MDEENLPDWSLFSFFGQSEESISRMASSAKDGDGKFVMGFIGFVTALGFFPISLAWFIISNGFRVSTKTWVYFVIMIIVIIVVTIQTLIQ